MTQPTPGGEVRPGRSQPLSHAPGVRYVDRSAPGDSRPGSASLRSAVVYGLAASVGVAVLWMVGEALVDLTYRMVAVAFLGGWAIGAATGYGAWRGREHAAEPRVRRLAAGAALGTWLLGTFLAYVLALAIIPGSSSSLAEKIAAQPFPQALAAQLSPLDALELLLLGVMAWPASR